MTNTPCWRPAPRTGVTIGAWKLRERFHECAAGHTYRAEDTRRPEERVLIKILRPELCADDTVLGRYFAELRTIDGLNHPNLVRVKDYAARAEGDKYVILEDPGEAVDLMTGIRLEGVLRGFWPSPDGPARDHAMYAITKDDHDGGDRWTRAS